MAASASLEPELLDHLFLTSNSEVRDFEQNQIVYRNPRVPHQPGLHLIHSGRFVLASCKSAGEPVGLAFLTAEDFFGFESLNGGSYTTFVKCLDPGRILFWPAPSIEDLQRSRPLLGIALGRAMTQRFVEMQTRIEQLSRVKTLRERLALFLLELAEKYDGPLGESAVFPPLTHEVISWFVGATRAAITHEMKHFARHEFLEYDCDRIELRRIPEFVAWIEGTRKKIRARQRGNLRQNLGR